MNQAIFSHGAGPSRRRASWYGPRPMKRPRLLIVKTGVAPHPVGETHGDFEHWFMDAFGERARFTVASAFAEGCEVPSLPSFQTFDGVVVTGSPASVTAPSAWMESLALRMREHSESGGALLGVCFGHQLLCHAFGAPVERNPAGREAGTVVVELTDEGQRDPLFEGLPGRLVVNATHVDRASRLPDDAALLASNANSPVQAVRTGPRARGVQFHPEITPPAMRAMVRVRDGLMRSEGLDPEAIEAAVEGAPLAALVLRHFEDRLCGRT
jgi:GMP synthase (glutamine-hydrolysing)